jgi:hypothetical protein
MKKYKVRTKEVLIRDIYVYADNEQQAEITAMVGPLERVVLKEKFHRMKETEIPLKLMSVKEVDDSTFFLNK